MTNFTEQPLSSRDVNSFKNFKDKATVGIENIQLPQVDKHVTTRHGIMLANTRILLPTEIICEVSSDLPVCRLPNSPEWLCGMTNLRGNIVPIIDLVLLLKLGRRVDDNLKLLFLNIDDEWVGMHSEGLPVLLEFMPDSKKAAKSCKIAQQLKAFVKGVYRAGDNDWYDFDLKSVFTWMRQGFNKQ